jgi:hypothetical protein
MGVFIPSTQLHYRRLILLLNTTNTATCFGRTTILANNIFLPEDGNTTETCSSGELL